MTQSTSSLMRKANVYGFCTTSMMWHLRAYLKCVAIGENLPLHDLEALGHLDHSYVFRRVREQMDALATGSHPFVLRKVQAFGARSCLTTRSCLQLLQQGAAPSIASCIRARLHCAEICLGYLTGEMLVLQAIN